MKKMILVAGAAALAMSAGSALAGGAHKASGLTAAAPKQPIPYSQLDSYLKASPKQRAGKHWWAQAEANTGASADTSATARTVPNDTPMPSGAVNPLPSDATAPPAPPIPDPAAPNADQGKGEMSNPATDKPH
jgi:hypothetical protein